MQKMKRILSLALALVMVLSLLPTIALAADSAPALPTAKVAEITHDNLTFAMNFRVNSVTAEQLSYYGDWYADFELTVNKAVTFNSDGSADGWLAGQYDEWSYDWVSVPFGNNASVSLRANETVKIMAFAAEYMNKPGLKYTFKEVVEVVKDFYCGVYFDDEFLANNPDLVVTLELKMYNPANEAENYVIGETYTYENPIVAQNTTTGKVYTGVTAAMMDAQADETVILLKDATETMLYVFEGATLDLNGYTLATNYASCFGDIIDSSAANSGLLAVPSDRFLIRDDNMQLPVRNGNGYRFVEVLGFNTTMDGPTKFVFQPLIETGALEWLKAGTAASGVTIRVQISWMQNDGLRTQNFVYNDNLLVEFIDSHKGGQSYRKVFTLTLNGVENIENLTFTAVVVSDNGVSFTPDTLRKPKPAGNVTTNANNQVVNDVTIGNGNASALVPSGTQLESGANNVTLNATAMEKTTSNITLGDGEQLVSMNVHVDGVAANNTKPIIVTLAELAVEGLNQNNIALYHVENGETVLMTRVYSLAEVDAHNEYYYDIATGTITMALATFSEIALRSNPNNPWDGSTDTTWYNDTDSSFVISNAEQLAGLGELVDGGNTFDGKTIYLGFDIDLMGTKEDGVTRLSFNPIGYGYNTVFKGTVRGQGHTIRNLYQNGWDLGLSYSTAAGGLFASVVDAEFYDLTLDYAYVVMECIDMGTLVGYAYGTCHFENIIVSNSVIANYNRYTGGVVGEVNGTHTFINVDVPSSTTISALWGTFDPAIGGIIGGVYGGAKVTMKLCDVAAVLDVYNDVTSAYRWYSYRRCGMLIGYTEESKTENGRTEATATFLNTENCTVQYGDWANYTYCQFSAENYPFVRVQEGLFNDPCSNPRYGHPVGADGNKVSDPNHTFSPAHNAGESHGLSVVFHQLYGGGQGCYGGNGHIGNGVTEITNVTAENKFVAKIPQNTNLIAGHTYTLGELFAASGLGEQIQNLSINAYVSSVSAENAGAVNGTFVRENNWADSKLTLTGKGTVTITINDYYYCNPTVITVNVVAPAKIGDTEYDTVQAALEAAKDGETVTLQADVPVSQYLDIFTDDFGKEERSITLDLNGHTISMGANYKYQYYPLVFVGINQTVTIKNGSIIADKHVAVGAYGQVNLENVTIESKNLDSDEQALCIWNWSETDEYYQDCQFLITGSANISNSTITGGILAEGPVTLKDAQVKFDALYLNNKTAHGKIFIDLMGYGLVKQNGYYTNLHRHEYVDNVCATCGLATAFVLTDFAEITSTDVVVITMKKGDTTYALSSSNGTSDSPDATVVTVDGNTLSGTIADALKWNILNANGNLTIYPSGTNSSRLYCTDTNTGVRVGTNDNYLFTITDGYLHHTATGRYLGVYTSGQDWRSYTTINTNIQGQTLGFYVLKTNCKHENTELRAAIAATCMQTGHEEGLYCLDCDTYAEGGALIPATGHTLGEYTIITPSTCMETGKARAHCLLCNKVSTVTTPKLNHNYGDNNLCVDCGSKRAVKYVFDDYFEGKQFAADEVHELDENITMITTQCHFTSELRIYGSDAHDGIAIINVASGNVMSGLGFQAGNEKATLNVYGFNLATGEWELIEAVSVASAYDDYEIDFGDKLYTSLKLDAEGGQIRLKDITIAFAACAHTNATQYEAQDATCTEDGYTAGTYCADCNTWTGHEKIPATGHVNTTTTTVDATCTENGSTTITCSCGHVVSEEVIEAPGHTWQAASCTEARTCSKCGATDGEALGHIYSKETITQNATCTTEGSKTLTCECGASKTETIPATGHVNTTTTTVAATCGKDGSVTTTCACGELVNKTTLPATGNHTYENGKCTGCGADEPSVNLGWYLVTDVKDLVVGDTIIIVAKDKNYALSTSQGNNNRGQASYNKTGEPGTTVQKLTLQAGTVSSTFAFYTGSGYLYAASSSSNYLRTQTTNNANSSWKITIAADGTATIIAQGTYTRNVMQYNSSSGLFACYSSASQAPIVIYKYGNSSTGGDVHTHTYVEKITAAATCTSAGTKTFTCSCSDSYTETIPALGHDLGNDNKCDREGCNYEETAGVQSYTESLKIAGTTGQKTGSTLISWSSTNVTFTNDKASSTTAIRTSDSDHYRAYAGSNLIISVPDGGNITEIVITCTSTSYMGLATTDSNVTITKSGTTYTIVVTGSASEITLKAASQTRVTGITVTYEK